MSQHTTPHPRPNPGQEPMVTAAGPMGSPQPAMTEQNSDTERLRAAERRIAELEEQLRGYHDDDSALGAHNSTVFAVMVVLVGLIGLSLYLYNPEIYSGLINTPEATQAGAAVEDAAEAAGDTAQDATAAASDAAQDATAAAGDAAEDAGQAAQDAAADAEQTAEQAGQAVGQAAEDAAAGAEQTAEDAANAAGDAANEAQDAAQDAAADAGDAAEDATTSN